MKILLLVFSIIFLVQPVLTIQAQETVLTQTSLGVDPAILEIILEPGKQDEKIIHVNNSSNLPLPIKAVRQTFVAKEIVNVPEEKLNIFDASSWLELAPEDEDFILQPKEVKEIVVKFNPPENASPGGHYASLIFQPLIPQELVSNQSVFVYARVAVLVFMQVKGDIKQELSYNQVKIDSLYNEFPIQVSTKLENIGNTHLRPEGKLIIYDELNRTVKTTVEIVPSIILPELIKEYPVTIDSIYDYGQYSAQFIVSYGDDQIQILSEKHYFTVFPYRATIIILIILVILYLVFFRLRKRIHKAGKVLFESNDPILFTSIKNKKTNLIKKDILKINKKEGDKLFYKLSEKNKTKSEVIKSKLHSIIKTYNPQKNTKGTLKKKNLFTHISIKQKTFTDIQKENKNRL